MSFFMSRNQVEYGKVVTFSCLEISTMAPQSRKQIYPPFLCAWSLHPGVFLALVAGRRWLKRDLCPCNLLHLDSADKQAISCGKRGCVSCETVVLEAARKDLSQMQVWCSVIIVDRDPEK
jgi:hypothetical protein